MKKSNLKAKLGIALLFAVFSMNAIHAFNGYNSNDETDNNCPTENRAVPKVECRCGLAWGKGCKADNSGSICTASTEECWTFDKNCSSVKIVAK